MCQKSDYFSNYYKILQEVRAIAKQRKAAEDIQVMVVTKYASAQQIAALMQGGKVDIIGESRLKESLEKWSSPLLKDYKPKKFFIGRVQTNKAAGIINNFDCICSLDSLHLAECLEKQALKAGKQVDCLIQIKLTDRQTQSGISPQQAESLIKAVRANYPHIKLKGIMAIAPNTQDENILRECFKKAKAVFDSNFSRGDYLSLGMSGDYKTAVEQGSNLPRIGSAVFKQI